MTANLLKAAILLAVGLLFAVLVGGLGAGLSRAVYVPVLVPVALGALIAVPMAVVSHMARLRHRMALVVVSALVWSVCLITFHYVEYRYQFVPSMSELSALEGGAPLVTDAERLAVADLVLESAVGQGGFVGFLRLRAEGGVRLRASGTVTPEGWASVAVWGLDVLVGLAVLLRILLGVARRAPPVVSEAPAPL